jgi:hypothetical protein
VALGRAEDNVSQQLLAVVNDKGSEASLLKIIKLAFVL